MLQSKAAMYGVLAVVEIAKRQAAGARGVQAHEVAKAFGLPSAYGAKVMSQLAKAGILQSGRGPRGGFRLLKGPEEITLFDIVRAVNEQVEAADRPADLQSDSAQNDVLNLTRQAMARAMERLCEELRRTTVADLIASESSKCPA